MRNSLLVAISLAVAAAVPSAAATRASISGKVADSHGKPLANATVMVYHAGVKKGYSTFCPSCYVDCGKRVLTDQAGAFTIRNLDPDLWFELLVVRDGYTATFIDKVDPALGLAETARLLPRAEVNDPDRVVRGRVVDTHGRPLPAAVVEPQGVATASGSMYGTIDGLEPIAVTNARGEFELAYGEKANGMVLRVEARGMATKLIAASTGADRKNITVSDGAVIRGRLMNHGKPVEGAELGLTPRERGGYGANLSIVGNPYDEIRIGTQKDGSFVITNVPAGVDWYVYGKMESIAPLGATEPVAFSTKSDNEEVNVGDIEIQPGHRVGGKITLSDGAIVPGGMRITIGSAGGWDSQTVMIGRDGHFEFAGVPAGEYEIFPSVRGYSRDTIETKVDRDRNDLVMVLNPSARQ